MEQRREKVLAEWSKFPIKVEELCAIVGVKAVGDLTLDHVVQLAGLRTAIKDGDTTLDSVLAEVRGRATVVGGLRKGTTSSQPAATASSDALRAPSPLPPIHKHPVWTHFHNSGRPLAPGPRGSPVRRSVLLRACSGRGLNPLGRTLPPCALTLGRRV
jgi:hypothetical protein